MTLSNQQLAREKGHHHDRPAAVVRLRRRSGPSGTQIRLSPSLLRLGAGVRLAVALALSAAVWAATMAVIG